MKNDHGTSSTLARLALAAGAVALAPALAQAQSQVTIYGTMDAGVLTQNKTRTADDNLTRVESSGIRPSVLGFKGTEDLGGGLKAFFNLEHHMVIDTGTFNSGGAGDTNAFWRRQSNVGLSGEWGSVTIGRIYSPALLAHLATEPRAFKEQFSNLYAWAYNTLTPTTNTNNDVGVFLKNAIQYRGTFGPVSGGIAYSLGEGTAGRALALGAAYDGPVALSLSWAGMEDRTTNHRIVEQTSVGAALPLGAFTVKAHYIRGVNDTPAGVEVSKVDAWGVGADWRWHPANTATLAFYRNKDKRNGEDATRNLVISNDYALSKRTTIYAQAAFVDAKSQASLKSSIVADFSFRPDATTTFLNVGINHTF